MRPTRSRRRREPTAAQSCRQPFAMQGVRLGYSIGNPPKTKSVQVHRRGFDPLRVRENHENLYRVPQFTFALRTGGPNRHHRRIYNLADARSFKLRTSHARRRECRGFCRRWRDTPALRAVLYPAPLPTPAPIRGRFVATAALTRTQALQQQALQQSESVFLASPARGPEYQATPAAVTLFRK